MTEKGLTSEISNGNRGPTTLVLSFPFYGHFHLHALKKTTEQRLKYSGTGCKIECFCRPLSFLSWAVFAISIKECLFKEYDCKSDWCQKQ